MPSVSRSKQAGQVGPSPSVGTQGHVYTWGFCTHGQLGIKEQILGMREYIEVPTRAGTNSQLRDVEIRTAACGHFHSLVVDASGNVFSFGRNDRGQLGCGADDAVQDVATPGALPRRLRSLQRSVIVDVACGAFHCLARVAEGDVMSWGWNKFGQLGRPTCYQTDSTPELVSEARGVSGPARSIAAGFQHSAAVLISGQVIAWGSNEFGQLGCGPAVKHPEVATTPVAVHGVVGKQVAAGDQHLLVLTAEGRVCAAGASSYGRLGLGDEDPAAEKERCGRLGQVICLPWGEAMDAEKIVAAAAGGATSAAISSLGRLFTWGGGVWGQLGTGSRGDRDTPAQVLGLPSVTQIRLAQDHALALCKVESKRSAAPLRGELVVGLDEPETEPQEEPQSLWIWGRRRLVPTGLGCAIQDPEAQTVPVEVPLDAFGPLQDLGRKEVRECREKHPLVKEPAEGAVMCSKCQACFDEGTAMWSCRLCDFDLCAKCRGTSGASSLGLRLNIECGGSHSLVLAAPIRREDTRRREVAARCPRMCTVTGPGTRGGRVSELLPFRIVSRDEDGRDEKIGGLRFRVWATPQSSKAGPRRRLAQDRVEKHGATLHQWDAHPFELQRLEDCRNGTYGGAYVVRRPGSYLLYVSMLPPDAEQELQGEGAGTTAGEPVSGSPFQITVDSGPAVAALCSLQVRGSSTSAGMAACNGTSDATFTVESCAEVIWDVLIHDLLGNPSTLKTDRFSAHIARQDAAVNAVKDAEEKHESTMEAQNPQSPQPRSTASALVELVRQRKTDRETDRAYERLAATFYGSQFAYQQAKTNREEPLRVQPAKEAGLSMIRWTPGAVGQYKLAVSLLRDEKEQPISGSPFSVLVVPGKPSASHSQLIVDGKVEPCGEPSIILEGTPASAEVGLRIVLRDRMGNISRENSDPLKCIAVRVENVSVVGDPAARPPKLLEWRVHGKDSKGRLQLSLEATDAMQKAASRATEAGASQDGWCVLQFFITATVKASRQRISGTPWRFCLYLKAPAVDASSQSVLQPAATRIELAEADEAGRVADSREPLASEEGSKTARDTALVDTAVQRPDEIVEPVPRSISPLGLLTQAAEAAHSAASRSLATPPTSGRRERTEALAAEVAPSSIARSVLASVLGHAGQLIAVAGDLGSPGARGVASRPHSQPVVTAQSSLPAICSRPPTRSAVLEPVVAVPTLKELLAGPPSFPESRPPNEHGAFLSSLAGFTAKPLPDIVQSHVEALLAPEVGQTFQSALAPQVRPESRQGAKSPIARSRPTTPARTSVLVPMTSAEAQPQTVTTLPRAGLNGRPLIPRQRAPGASGPGSFGANRPMACLPSAGLAVSDRPSPSVMGEHGRRRIRSSRTGPGGSGQARETNALPFPSPFPQAR